MNKRFELHNYDDIINLPHHVSKNRKRMTSGERAAQFSPFAALTGYDEAVIEAARLTDERKEMTEEMKSLVDAKIQIIADYIDTEPYITVIYFLPDSKKEGGAYVRIAGKVRAVDNYERRIIFADKTFVSIDQIKDIESDLFDSMLE